MCCYSGQYVGTVLQRIKGSAHDGHSVGFGERCRHGAHHESAWADGLYLDAEPFERSVFEAWIAHGFREQQLMWCRVGAQRMQGEKHMRGFDVDEYELASPFADQILIERESERT